MYINIKLIIITQGQSENLFRIMISFWKKKQTKQGVSNVSSYKASHSLAERAEKRDSLKQKYPEDKFCVLVIEGLMDLPTNTKLSKPFLLMGMQRKMNVLHLIGYLKKILNVNQSNSLFVEAGGTVLAMTTIIGQLCHKFTDDDGFIYVKIKTQDSF